MLINVGFSIGRVNSDYFVMHDVDLLPLNDDLKYSYPSEGPMHLSSPELHPLYHYKKFVGGILMMTNNDFVKVNMTGFLFNNCLRCFVSRYLDKWSDQHLLGLGQRR